MIARITARTPALSKKQVYQAATQEFLDQAKTAITQRKHFTLETNFRDESPLSVLDEFKRYGYTINMVYLTLEHTQQSIDRVNQRVKSGGHFVDDKNIRENYEIGLQYLERYADRFDNLEIFIASGIGFALRSLLSIQHKTLVHLSNVLPDQLAGTINAVAGQFPPRSPEQYETPSRSPKR